MREWIYLLFSNFITLLPMSISKPEQIQHVGIDTSDLDDPHIFRMLHETIDRIDTLSQVVIPLTEFPAIKGVQKAGAGTNAYVVFQIPLEKLEKKRKNRIVSLIQNSLVDYEPPSTEVRVPLMECLMHLSDLTDSNGPSNIPEIFLNGKTNDNSSTVLKISSQDLSPKIISDICMRLLEADILSSEDDRDLAFRPLVEFLREKGMKDFEESVDTAIQSDIHTKKIQFLRFLYRYGVVGSLPNYDKIAEKRKKIAGKPKTSDLVKKQGTIFTSENSSASRFVNLLLFSALGVHPQAVLEGRGAVEIPIKSETGFGIDETKTMTMRIKQPEDKLFMVDKVEEYEDVDSIHLLNTTVRKISIVGSADINTLQIKSRELLTFRELYESLNKNHDENRSLLSQSKVSRSAKLHGGEYDHIIIFIPIQNSGSTIEERKFTIVMRNFEAKKHISLRELPLAVIRMARVKGKLLFSGITGQVEVQSSEGDVIAESSPDLELIVKNRTIGKVTVSGIGKLRLQGCTISGQAIIDDCPGGIMEDCSFVDDGSCEITFSPGFTLQLNDEERNRVKITE